jgi:hypothetical protein
MVKLFQNAPAPALILFQEIAGARTLGPAEQRQ